MPGILTRSAAVLGIAVCLLLLPGLVRIAAGAPAQVPATLEAGAEIAFPPYSEADAAGKPTGFAVELFSAVARAVGLRVHFHSGTWDEVWNGLREGRLDALPLVAWMPAREGQVELTSPHTIGYDSFFVRNGTADIDTVEAARSRSVIVMRSDAAHQALVARGFRRQLVLVDSLAEGFRLLAAGQQDAVLAPRLQGRRLVRTLGLEGAIHPGPTLHAYRREFCFAVRKGNLALRDRLERGLAKVQASGEYDRLYRRWLGINDAVSFPTRYLVGGGAAFVVLAALVALWTWTLRREVTRRTVALKRANVEIQAHRSRLLDLLQRLPVYVCLLTRDYRIAFANRFFERRYGSPGEKRCYEHLLGRAEPCEVCDSFRVFDTNSPVAWSWQAPKGREYEVHCFPFTDSDGTPMVMEVGIDVTETRRAQRELKQVNASLEQRVRARTAELAESEARYRTLFDSMSEGFALHEIILDDEGRPCDYRFLDVNPAFEALTGLRADQLLGRRVLEVMPELERSWIESYGEVALGGEPARFERFSASLDRWYEVFAYQPVPRRFAVVFSDISERKRAEAALREADRRKDEFLAMLAHELRNPLAPIRSAVDIMRLVDLPDPRLRRVREILDRQVTHLSRLVDDLLDVSRIVRGKIELKRTSLTLDDWVAQAIEAARPLIEARRHQVAVTLPKRPIRLDGDPVRLVQILLNLLSNAAKYTQEGGRIEVEGKVQGQELQLRVRDNGLGIPEELLPRVFDLFQQGERTLDRSHGGLGIGLALVKQLVELHGGRVKVESPGGDQGTTCTLWLPLPEQTGALPVLLPSAPTVRGLHILVVDDDQPVAESTAMLLQLQGHHVAWVAGGEEALARVAADPPDVVLMDLGMPGLDGYETARRIRALPGGEGIRLLATTGYGDAQTRERVLGAGFDGHLVKPVDAMVLRVLLEPPASAVGEKLAAS